MIEQPETVERLIETAKELEAFVENRPGGWKDDDAVAKIRSLVNTIFWSHASTEYARSKAKSALIWAEIVYSARRHQQWGEPKITWQHMFTDCVNLTREVESLRQGVSR